MFEIIILCLEIVGTISFAVSAGITGIDKGLDYFGIIFISVTTAVGGGFLRDIILGVQPPIMFIKPIYILVAIITTMLLLMVFSRYEDFFFENRYTKFIDTINIADAIGLGVFTIVGINTAFSHGHTSLFLCVFLGLMTGVGGGMMRDILVQRTPLIFRTEIYAIAALVGGVIYYFLYPIAPQSLAMIVSVVIIVFIRLYTLKKQIHLPTAYRGK